MALFPGPVNESPMYYSLFIFMIIIVIIVIMESPSLSSWNHHNCHHKITIIVIIIIIYYSMTLFPGPVNESLKTPTMTSLKEKMKSSLNIGRTKADTRKIQIMLEETLMKNVQLQEVCSPRINQSDNAFWPNSYLLGIRLFF